MIKKLSLYGIIGLLILTSAYAVNESVMSYDLSNITQSANLYEFVKFTNDITGQTLMSGLLVAGFIILFISMKNYGNKEALLGSGFIISSITILFLWIDFVSTAIASFILIGFGLLFMLMLLRKDF